MYNIGKGSCCLGPRPKPTPARIATGSDPRALGLGLGLGPRLSFVYPTNLLSCRIQPAVVAKIPDLGSQLSACS